MLEKKIRSKERDAIIQSLKSGVTPKIGIQHIQVGRVNELKAMIQDIERLANGGSTFRLIIGEYGSSVNTPFLVHHSRRKLLRLF